MISLSDGSPPIRRAAVFGLARSGKAAARALAERGVEVIGTDARGDADVDASDLPPGVRLELFGHRDDVADGVDVVIVSPGVPPSIPALARARARGTPIVAEIELAARLLDGPVIGITGTNGKSTTTSLCAAILDAAGRPAVACGNLGTPWVSYATAERASEAAARPIWVVELSSFQLEATRSFRPDVAVLLNLTPDHLDRHGTMEAYGAAKERILAEQTPAHWAVLNADDPWVRDRKTTSRRMTFSRLARQERGVWLEGDAFWSTVTGPPRVLATREDLRLAGAHNEENAMAALCATAVFDVAPEAAARALRAFVPLPHRMTLVRTLRGVAYYDDSKGTNVDAAMKSLEGLPDGRVFAILGGKRKNDDFRRLRGIVGRKARLVLAIGATQDEIATALDGAAPIVRAGTLDAAVARACAESSAGDVVLLSPACASFDQFRNFEHRGEVFAALVRALPEVPARSGGAAAR